MKFASVSTSIVLSFLLVLPAVLSGCSTKSAAPEPVEAGITALASGGVGVYDSYAAKGPTMRLEGTVSAMRVTRWQLQNMIGQASAGMGMTGASLDAFDRSAQPSAHGFSAFLAAWLTLKQGALATYAAGFMPKNADYSHPAKLVYPTLVVTLFIADAARKPHAAAAAPAPERHVTWERWIAAPASAAGTCSTVTNFVSSVVDDVTNALMVSGDGFFPTLWNAIVGAVVNATAEVIKAALAPIIKVIKLVASVLSMVTIISSSLQPWTVSLQANPASVTLLGTTVDGKFVATVDNGAISWPDELKDCAQSLASIDLDTISTKDAPVTWQTSGEIPERASDVDEQKTIGADKTATLTYRTLALADPQKEECSNLESRGSIGAYVSVERVDITRLQQALAKASLSLLPDAVQNFILPAIQPWIDSATQTLTNLISAPVTAVATASLMAYEKDSSKCTPQPAAVPSATGLQPVTVVTATPGDTYTIVGHWACVLPNKVAVTNSISIGVDVHVEFDFMANGMAVASFPMSATGTFNPSGGSVQADKDMKSSEPEPYSYTPNSDNPSYGRLHYPSATFVSSRDQAITFMASNDVFWSIVTSPQSGQTMVMKCARKK